MCVRASFCARLMRESARARCVLVRACVRSGRDQRRPRWPPTGLGGSASPPGALPPPQRRTGPAKGLVAGGCGPRAARGDRRAGRRGRHRLLAVGSGEEAGGPGLHLGAGGRGNYIYIYI